MKFPNNVSGIFDVAGLLERLKRNGVGVIARVEGGDDDKGGVGIALKFFELADGVVDAEFDIVVRNDLKIVKTDDRSFFRLKAKKTNTIGKSSADSS